MPRTFRYAALFVSVLLLQLFLFDNLTLSVYLNPLVYLAFLLLLPLETPPIGLLGAGLLLGLSTDLAMGAAGINTVATLPVAFLRPTLLSLLCNHENLREGGVPSPERLGARLFLLYTGIATVFHHTLFFLLEALSWHHLPYTLVRIVVSSAVSLGFTWLIARVFNLKLPGRI